MQETSQYYYYYYYSTAHNMVASEVILSYWFGSQQISKRICCSKQLGHDSVGKKKCP